MFRTTAYLILMMLVSSPVMASDKMMKSILQKANSEDPKARAFAISQLKAKKNFKHNALFVSRLKAAPVDAPDVGPIFLLWQKKTPAQGAAAALEWLARATSTKRWSENPVATSNLRSAAIWVDARDRGDEFRDVAVKLAAHPDEKVAADALRILEHHARKKGQDDGAPLFRGFEQHESLQLRYVRLLGQTGDRSLVLPLARAGVKFAEANPNYGAPEYVAALRKLSNKPGKHPSDWLHVTP